MNFPPIKRYSSRLRSLRSLDVPFSLIAACVLLLLTATRLPAPIHEETQPEATASPSPKTKPSKEQPANPSASPKSKPKENIIPVEKQTQPQVVSKSAHFSGKWRGILSGDLLADADITVIIDDEVGAAVVKGLHDMWGDRRGKIRIKGNTLFWNFLAEHWIMTVAPDGRSAAIVGQHWPVGSTSGTLQR